jgi:hypothetical protein
MSERISIREAARRLGVSDTAVHKAIKTGRVAVAGKTESGRPLMDWADTERRWLANSDVSKRSHVGSRGSPVRAQDAPRVKLTTSDRMDEAQSGEGSDLSGDGPRSGRGAGYAQARAVREVFQAKLAKLEYEERTEKLVSADEVKKQGHALAAGIISSLYNIPDRCADEIAGMSDPHAIHKLLLTEIDNAVEAIRKQYG